MPLFFNPDECDESLIAIAKKLSKPLKSPGRLKLDHLRNHLRNNLDLHADPLIAAEQLRQGVSRDECRPVVQELPVQDSTAKWIADNFEGRESYNCVFRYNYPKKMLPLPAGYQIFKHFDARISRRICGRGFHEAPAGVRPAIIAIPEKFPGSPHYHALIRFNCTDPNLEEWVSDAWWEAAGTQGSVYMKPTVTVVGSGIYNTKNFLASENRKYIYFNGLDAM